MRASVTITITGPIKAVRQAMADLASNIQYERYPVALRPVRLALVPPARRRPGKIRPSLPAVVAAGARKAGVS